MEIKTKKEGLKYLHSLQPKESILNVINDTGNSFPIEVFPAEMQNIIRETAKLNYSADYISGYMLGVISSAIGNSCKIQVKKGWLESAVVYLVCVGPPGTNKTAPLSFAIKPLMKTDAKSYIEYKDKVVLFKANEKLKPDEREEVDRPQLSKKIINDATIEAVHVRHQFNPRSLLVSIDELAGFFNNMNRYNKGSDQQQWLSNFSGSPISIDRKSDEPLRIETPHISIIGSTQNGTLNKMFADKVDDGMLDRFLICMPEFVSQNKWTDSEISCNVFDIWESIVNNISAIKMEEESYIFTFSEEAKKVLFDWQNNLEKSENAIVAGIDAKLQTYVIRFSLILHILKDSVRSNFPHEIQAITIRDAIKLFKYFKTTAVKIRQGMNLIDVFEGLDENKKKLFELLPDEFSYNDGKLITSDSKLMSESTFKILLKNKDLFRNPKRGVYQKIAE